MTSKKIEKKLAKIHEEILYNARMAEKASRKECRDDLAERLENLAEELRHVFVLRQISEK